MSIIDKVTSHLPGPLGKGPPGVPAPHNVSWNTPHEQVHRGAGQNGFPGRGDPGAHGHGPHGHGPQGNGPHGLGPPGVGRPSGLLPPVPPGPGSDPRGGPPGVDRPSGNGWGPPPGAGPGRPDAPGHHGHGAERPNGPGWAPGQERPAGPGNPAPGQGVERPVPGTPGQVIRDVIGLPPGPQAPGSPHGGQQPAGVHGGPHGSAGVAPQGAPVAVLAAGAASQPASAMTAQVAHLAHAPGIAPRADAHAQAAQVAPGVRADAAATPAALAPAGARPDAVVVPRTLDPGTASLQRNHAATVATVASFATAAQGTTAANAPGSTAAPAAATAATQAASPAVAGSTVATPPPVAQAADARNPGNPLAVNDRGLPARADAAGHTGENAQRRGLERRMRSLPGGLSTLLLALGAQGHAGSNAHDRAAAERELREAVLQWLFWLLAIIAYGCIAFAVIALLPSGSLGPLDGLAPRRGWTGGFVVAGLFTAIGAWWFARRMSRGADQDRGGG